jgi:hypothetical protein
MMMTARPCPRQARGWRGKALWTLVAVAASLAAGMSWAQAELDLRAALVGRWEGAAQLKKDADERVLVITSVEQRDGKWTARGEFGHGDERLHGVDIVIESTDTGYVLSFTAKGKKPGPVVLRLSRDGRYLSGTVWRHAGRVRGESDPLNLEKAP